jgi:phosphoribosylanthranilate isomerase
MWGVREGAPHIKICGVTRLEDARLAADLGAWAVGLIFYEGSPRRADVGTAGEIAAALRRRVEVVGVFVNASLDEVAATADAAGLTMLQLHGDEGPAFCAEVARRTGCRVIKAARIRSGADLQALRAFRACDLHLLDNHAPGSWGGTGEAFDWSLLAEHRPRVPFVLSGGLHPGNVGDAIATVHPFAVDVASGVEAEPGIKDPEKLEAFFAAVRATAPAAA